MDGVLRPIGEKNKRARIKYDGLKDFKELEEHENEIKIGSPVGVHRYTIFKVLDEKELKRIEPFYSEFLKTRETK